MPPLNPRACAHATLGMGVCANPECPVAGSYVKACVDCGYCAACLTLLAKEKAASTTPETPPAAEGMGGGFGGTLR